MSVLGEDTLSALPDPWSCAFALLVVIATALLRSTDERLKPWSLEFADAKVEALYKRGLIPYSVLAALAVFVAMLVHAFMAVHEQGCGLFHLLWALAAALFVMALFWTTSFCGESTSQFIFIGRVFSSIAVVNGLILLWTASQTTCSFLTETTFMIAALIPCCCVLLTFMPLAHHHRLAMMLGYVCNALPNQKSMLLLDALLAGEVARLVVERRARIAFLDRQTEPAAERLPSPHATLHPWRLTFSDAKLEEEFLDEQFLRSRTLTMAAFALVIAIFSVACVFAITPFHCICAAALSLMFVRSRVRRAPTRSSWSCAFGACNHSVFNDGLSRVARLHAVANHVSCLRDDDLRSHNTRARVLSSLALHRYRISLLYGCYRSMHSGLLELG